MNIYANIMRILCEAAVHIYMYIYIHICTYIYLRAWPRAGPWALGRAAGTQARSPAQGPGPGPGPAPCKDIWFLWCICIYVYIFELIVFLYVGMNIFWIFYFFKSAANCGLGHFCRFFMDIGAFTV